jgi:hypothetical protein
MTAAAAEAAKAEIEKTLILTDSHADNLGYNLSSKLRAGLYVVVYADGKNGRIVVNIYPQSAENTARIKRQIGTFKARVFEAGRRLDESIFGGK